MRAIVILIFTLVFSGCATIYEECDHLVDYPEAFEICQDEVRMWRDGIDAENWEMCELAYRNSGVPTMHYDHTHDKFRGIMTESSRKAAIRSDLLANRCRSSLKDWWIDY